MTKKFALILRQPGKNNQKCLWLPKSDRNISQSSYQQGNGAILSLLRHGKRRFVTTINVSYSEQEYIIVTLLLYILHLLLYILRLLSYILARNKYFEK